MAQVSVFRLRLGVVLIAIFWIPVWLLAPLVASFIDQPIGRITLTIAIIQTVIGALGVLIAGRQTLAIVRHTKTRAVPRTVWHVVWTGELSEPDPEQSR